MNVILINTDDQGYGDTSFLNKNSKFQTPNIDRIAKEGISFSDAHCSSAICSPSRYGLLTGRYSWRTRLKSGVLLADDDCLISSGRATLATLFQKSGYKTLMVGKWHLGMKFSGEFGNRNWDDDILDGPIDHGFDYFYGIPASMNFGILTYIENRKVTEPARVFTGKKPINSAISDFHFTPPYKKTKDLDHGEYIPESLIEIAPSFKDEETLHILTDKAMQKVRECAFDEEPFFLYLALNSPHKPVCPSKAFKDVSDAGRYGDFMIETDYHVGRLLDCLEELNISEDTMVVFTSDNGAENTYITRKEKYNHDSSGGLRGGKRDIYEGGHRVPFFIRYPKKIEAGRICNEPICQTDLYSTFAEMLGKNVDDNEAEDSVSILPALVSNDYKSGFRGPMINHSGAGYFAVRDGSWKLNLLNGIDANVKRCDIDAKKPKYELFNLSNDLKEENDIINEHPDIADRLKKLFFLYLENGRSTKGLSQENDGGNIWQQITNINIV